MTHPFHPLYGREFRLVCRKRCWGQDRVSCQEEDGRTRSFPTAWTNFADEDAFVRVSAGRSSFRVADLLELADVIDRAKAGEGVDV